MDIHRPSVFGMELHIAKRSDIPYIPVQSFVAIVNVSTRICFIVYHATSRAIQLLLAAPFCRVVEQSSSLGFLNIVWGVMLRFSLVIWTIFTIIVIFYL